MRSFGMQELYSLTLKDLYDWVLLLIGNFFIGKLNCLFWFKEMTCQMSLQSDHYVYTACSFYRTIRLFSCLSEHSFIPLLSGLFYQSLISEQFASALCICHYLRISFTSLMFTEHTTCSSAFLLTLFKFTYRGLYCNVLYCIVSQTDKLQFF